MPSPSEETYESPPVAAGLLWAKLTDRPVLLKLRSSTAVIGFTAFVAAFTVSMCDLLKLVN